MLTNILGSGRSSRLHQRLVEKEGVADERQPLLLPSWEKAGLHCAFRFTGQVGRLLLKN